MITKENLARLLQSADPELADFVAELMKENERLIIDAYDKSPDPMDLAKEMELRTK